MRKWSRKLRLEKKGKSGALEQGEKIMLKNKLKKYLAYIKLLMLRRTSISYAKKYSHVASILI